MKSTKTFNWFRKIAFAEGVSFMVLLLIAMPLKYFANLPVVVTIVGSLHGFLFIAFIAIAWVTMNEYNRTWSWLIKSFIASIVPLGTFWMDHKVWKKEEAGIR
jgi:integral membrane protein